MQKKRPALAYVFSILIAVTAAIVAYYSLHHLKIYSANTAYLTHILIGRDSVILYIGAPLLLIAGLLALRESNRAYLAWLGVQAYFLITYLWYACGIAYNQFFLIYIALFAGALFSFIRTLLAMDAEIFCLRFSPETPIRWVAVCMFCGGLALAYQWLNPLLPVCGGAKQPIFLRLYGPTMMIHPLLNLGIISPTALVASIWIWKRKPWGYISASILLLYGLITSLAFLVTQWIVYSHGQPINKNETLLLCAIALVILILWSGFLKNLREETLHDHHSQISSMG